MADYSDWFESTFGGGDEAYGYNESGGGDGEDYEPTTETMSTSGRYERDAVLCMVDCRREMFSTSSSARCTSAAKVEPGVGLPSGNPSSSHEGAEASLAAPISPFTRALRAILQLYQEKILTSERDVLGLVLYHTEHHHNNGNFAGVFVMQEFHLLNAQSIREVEELGAAGVMESAAFRRFQESIGSSSSNVDSPTSSLSDALWAAQHLFLHRRLQQVRHKRIFLFTNDDNPPDGRAMEQERCFARARDLAQSGVELEVFSLSSASSVSIPSATNAPPPPPLFDPDRFWQPLLRQAAEAAMVAAAAAASQRNAVMSASRQGSVAATPTRSPPPPLISSYVGAVHSDETDNPLSSLSDAVRIKAHPQVPFLKTRLRLGVRLPVEFLQQSPPPTSKMEYPDSSSPSASGNLDVKQEHGREEHSVGGGPPNGGGDTTRVPTLAVSIYTPIIPATGQRAAKIDAATNKRVIRRTELVVKEGSSSTVPKKRGPRGNGGRENGGDDENDNDNDDDKEKNDGDSEAEPRVVVRSREDITLSTVIGGQRLLFSAEERKAMAMAASLQSGHGSSSAPGITIVCFKPYVEVVHHELALKRANFIHLTTPSSSTPAASLLHTPGFQDASFQLFLQLWRVLHQRERVGIAEYVMRAGSAPRLVALIPSFTRVTQDDEREVSEEEEESLVPRRDGWNPAQVPVQGVGFYMMPLPYAEDLREIPLLANKNNQKAKPARPTAAARRTVRDGVAKVESDSITKAKVCGEVPTKNERDHQDVTIARQLIQALTVSYDITAVPNPAVQRKLCILQNLALRQPTVPVPPPTSSHATPLDSTSADCDLLAWRDYSLPDEAGLRSVEPLLRAFQERVVCGIESDPNVATVKRQDEGDSSFTDLAMVYNPDLLCMSASTRAATNRAARSAADVIASLPPSAIESSSDKTTSRQSDKKEDGKAKREAKTSSTPSRKRASSSSTSSTPARKTAVKRED